ncbi:unnamed protein product (macronuclear) [Paramecium tetraurelia]|uniref:Transmembrane protein n=1 Tax=Paramecium tetraurelia TaxID=5888 RepID=A0BQ89_PARTE|nr:uncharacterized protein GSPATT00030935001 [Paramecium tetraurelia]CAK60706.1 unnamed protein product [Paramecium tetraurelia]|eukprot:XP_001428104.1 hypothetical protein (macronuclear) [Paramecium tetraurelia strain d4-2]
MNFLKKADFFGVPFLQNINQQQALFKSTLGGLLSLLISVTSLAYAFWIIYLWKSNQMSPKISNSKYVSDYKLLDYNSGRISVYYEVFEGQVDPFESRILLPLVMYTDQFAPTEPMIIENYIESSIGKQYVPNLDLGYSFIDGYLQTSKQMYLFISLCEEKYLKENETCGSAQLREQFFQQRFNFFGIQVESTTLDSRDGSEQTTIQDIYIELELQSCYSINTFLETNFFELQDYLLFGTSKQKEYISGAKVQTQSLSAERCKLSYQNQALAVVYVAMNGTQTKTIFEYPYLGDLLANIGSIVSILFMIKYFIIYGNQYFLNQKILSDLMKIYYPEFKYIKIIKNWRFKVTKVTLNNKEVDQIEFNKFLDKIKNQMQQKLCYMNLLYEISRLYLIIRSSKSKEELLKSHQIGIKLNLSIQKEVNCLSNVMSVQRINQETDPFLLNEDDAELLSLPKRESQKYGEIIPEEIYNEGDYYLLNKII